MKVNELYEQLNLIDPDLEVCVVEGRLYFYYFTHDGREKVIDCLNAQTKMLNPDFSDIG